MEKVTTRLLIVILPMIVLVSSQNNFDYYREKSGSCPPPLPLQFCKRACFVDAHCQGIAKCCPTTCGGSFCSRPVTMRPNQQPDKPGSCPAVPTGRWVCSPTCSNDADCPGSRKCCRNRCGALACQKPEMNTIEIEEVPVKPSENDIPPVINDNPATPPPSINPNNPFLSNNRNREIAVYY